MLFWDLFKAVMAASGEVMGNLQTNEGLLFSHLVWNVHRTQRLLKTVTSAAKGVRTLLQTLLQMWVNI